MFDNDLMRREFNAQESFLKKALRNTCFTLAAFVFFVIVFYYAASAMSYEVDKTQYQIEKLKGE